VPTSGPGILLIPLDAPTLDQLAAVPGRYAEAHRLSLGASAALLREVAEQSRAFAARAGVFPPWGGYLAVDAATRAVVGTCSFKGPPDGEGAVEIAYFTFPGHEGRGYATAMADALRRRAANGDAVRVVRAHTAPERNASARILEKLGFRHLGPVIDPEDGSIWRWEWNPVRRAPVSL
jgi:RimJ/RimL family protein N-acetyltransferase